jgi:hypothetical protein
LEDGAAVCVFREKQSNGKKKVDDAKVAIELEKFK